MFSSAFFTIAFILFSLSLFVSFVGLKKLLRLRLLLYWCLLTEIDKYYNIIFVYYYDNRK